MLKAQIAVVSVVGMAVALFCGTPIAAATHELALISNWGSGQYRDVHLQGNYAYCAALRAGLDVVDVSDPAHPTLVANVPTRLGLDSLAANGVFVAGSHAYVAADSSNIGSALFVFNISDPTDPNVRSVLEPSPGDSYTGPIQVADQYAYLAHSDGGFDVIDVSDPGVPRWHAAFRGATSPNDLEYENGLVILTEDGDGWWIVDVSDPGSPSLVYASGPERMLGTFASGHHLYLGSWYSNLFIYDISVPGTPVLLHNVPMGGHCADGFLHGDLAIVSADASMKLVDVSDPGSAAVVGTYYGGDSGFFGGGASGATVLGSFPGAGALQTIDILDPTLPAQIAELRYPEIVYDVDAQGNHAYLATFQGLVILDISDPADPIPQSYYGYWVKQVLVAGEYAYIASNNGSHIEILDVSDPTDPQQIGTYTPPGLVSGFVLGGNYLYVGTDGLLILDVSVPSLPWQAGFWGTAAIPIHLIDHLLFAHADGPIVLDVENPSDVQLVNSFSSQGLFAVEPPYLYQCRWWPRDNEAFEIFDISDPTAVDLVSSMSGPCISSSRPAVSDGFAYVNAPYQGSYTLALYALDVRDPTTPVSVGTYDVGELGAPHDIQADFIYLADGYTGKAPIYRVVSAALALTKADSVDPVTPGTDLSYRLTVANSGWAGATEVVLIDTLPEDVSFLSSLPGAPTCTESAGIVTCIAGKIGVGAMPEVLVHTRVSTSASGLLINTASVSATQIDWDMTNNATAEETTVGPPICDLAVIKTDSIDPVAPGEPFTYAISVGNLGPSLAETVVLTDPLPEDLIFIGVDPGPPTCTESAGMVSCSLGPLDAGATQEVLIEVATNTDFMGGVTNVASVSGADLDPVPGNNEATETTFSTVVFADGFESGDMSAWSETTTCQGCPIADFTFSVNGLTVDFLNRSTGEPPLSYFWSFGDGTTSTQENPTHTYGSPGDYQVLLTVTNSLGIDSIMRVVTVLP